MNGLEELINLRDKGCKWLAINGGNFDAKVFKEMPYWRGDVYKGKWNSHNAMWTITLKNGEILALQKHHAFNVPFPINEVIEVLQKYRQQVDMQTDMVKRPDHYTWKKKECREIQRDMVDGLSGMAASNMGNIIKYLYRVGHKDDIKQDLDKAKQFIDFLYEELQRESN